MRSKSVVRARGLSELRATHLAFVADALHAYLEANRSALPHPHVVMPL